VFCFNLTFCCFVTPSDHVSITYHDHVKGVGFLPTLYDKSTLSRANFLNSTEQHQSINGAPKPATHYCSLGDCSFGCVSLTAESSFGWVSTSQTTSLQYKSHFFSCAGKKETPGRIRNSTFGCLRSRWCFFGVVACGFVVRFRLVARGVVCWLFLVAVRINVT
jgi:hypothetical protein